uniref:Splicing factor cc1-like protein n=1 Tax=Lotharella vacuolata TaxID=74820 RepID=A0A0H5BHI4_9EUKA|nr:splicing factor cc1-like protein [Lotharella vacuolata]
MFVLSKLKRNYFIDKSNNNISNFIIEKNYSIKNIKTIFVYNLNPDINEILLFRFFSQECSVIDVKLIKDKTSSKSKGLAYIEVINQKDIINALSLTGKTLIGNNLMIKASDSEKNLAWEIQTSHVPGTKSTESNEIDFRVMKHLAYYSNSFYSNILIKNISFYIKVNKSIYKDFYIHKLLSLFGSLVAIKIIDIEIKNSTFSIIASFSKKLDINEIFKKINGITILGKIIHIDLHYKI